MNYRLTAVALAIALFSKAVILGFAGDVTVPKTVLEGIHAEAKKTYPKDYNLQKYFIEMQVEAWKKVNGVKPNVPDDVLKKIKEKALKDHPDDHSVQEYVINEEIKAYESLHQGQAEKNGSDKDGNTKTISCKMCEGSGRVVPPGWTAKTKECPLCRGSGSRDVKLKPNETLCPSCGGMGRIDDSRVTARGKSYSAKYCSKCSGDGAISKSD